MNTHHDDPATREPWVGRAVALLDRSAEQLDAATLSRLNRARQSALASRRPRRAAWVVGGSLAGALAVLVLAVGLGLGRHAPPTSPPDVATSSEGDDVDSLADDDNLDLYENLDFYAWLDAQQQDVNG